MTTLGSRLSALLIAAGVVVAGAGCSSGGDSGSGSAASSTRPSATATSAATTTTSAGSSSGAAETTPTSAGAPGGDPCSFVTKEEVAAAIGTSISLAKVEDGQCGYFPTSSATSNGLYVKVGGVGAFDAMQRTMQDTIPVTGLGDDAFWAAPALRVKAGDREITVTVMDTSWNGGDSQGAAVAVARDALSRL